MDQKAFCPKLYALAALRTLIVKRPAITTAEVLAGPVRGRLKTHLVTGYVHKPYPRIYAMLARHAGFDSALIVRGVEGGVIPVLSPDRQGVPLSRRRRGDLHGVQAGRAGHRAVGARAAHSRRERRGRERQRRSMPPPWRKRPPRPAWRRSLAQPGATRDSLVYGAALCLWHLGRHGNLRSAADAVRGVLDRGKALEHLR